jgi:DNA (cytosine-5)-methyltransferase 1
MISVGSDFSGVGAFEQALKRLGVEHQILFACDMDEYARQTFCLNYGTEKDIELVYSKKHSELCKKIKRVVDKNEIFEPKHKPLFDEATAFAKQFSFYFDWNVYNREIPDQPLDIYVPTPPCQSFSLAGKRKGEADKRGILFYNSHEFIKKNKPKSFIFENVQGLLSDDDGKTFQRWVDYLGGKSVNGYPTFFPHEESVPYHIYYKVLNAKHYGIPQNRDRIFIIGIRDDEDDEFFFPQKMPLVKKLRDCLEPVVDKKYFLSDETIQMFLKHTANQKAKGNGFKFEPKPIDGSASAVTTRAGSRADDNFVEVGTWRTHEDGKGFRPTEDNNCPTIPARAREDGSGQPVIKITTNNEKGFEEFREGDSLNLNNINSKTRRGRVGKGVAQTLDTACNQVVIAPASPKDVVQINPSKESGGAQPFKQNRIYEGDIVGTLDTECGRPAYVIPNKTLTNQQQDKLENLSVDEDISGCITNAIGRAGSSDEFMASVKKNAIITQSIRRLTPLECFRLMDFNFDIPGVPDFKWSVSDTQAYKQAGNSVCVGVFVLLIKELLKIK